MTVYVDDTYKLALGLFRRMKMSHMIADTTAELHEFAKRLGLKRSWFQRDHYDVSMSVRTRAIALGAKEITFRECGLMTINRRRGECSPDAPLLTPEQGRAIVEGRARGDDDDNVPA